MPETAPRQPGLLVLLGCGYPPYRRYALAAAAAQVRVALVQPGGVDWQAPYVGDRHRIAAGGDRAATTAAVVDLIDGDGGDGPVGLLTWDETLIETAAAVAADLGLPHLSPAAAAACRDKRTTRRRLAEAGVGSARSELATDEVGALAAGAAIGYPVVVKPRALAGSLGVSLVTGPDQLRAAFRQADTSRFPGIDAPPGVLVEEYLDGPEISIDCAVHEGRVEVLTVTRKQLGFAPYFEEVGHVVAPWRHEPWADAVVALVRAAHPALGIDTGVTHTEVRLTARGPAVVEVNGRLGGDFIPLLGRIATGIDQVAVAADLATGRPPHLTRTGDGCAEVRFVYPAHDGIVETVDVSPALGLPGVVEAVALADPGELLQLPPVGVVPRLAAVIVRADDPATATRMATTAADAVRSKLRSAPA